MHFRLHRASSASSVALLRSLGLGVAILAAAGCSSSAGDPSSSVAASTISGTPTAAANGVLTTDMMRT